MLAFNILLTCFFSVFATAILSYISMAVMIGPWIESVIVIGASIIFSLVGYRLKNVSRVKSISLITAGSSLGGILATGCGFAFPTLYFLQPDLFNSWLKSPAYFVAIMASLAFAAGALGLMIADSFEHQLINVNKLPFPIGEVSYKLASVKDNLAQTLQLLAGGISAVAYGIAASFITAVQRLTLIPAFQWNVFKIPAIGIPLNEFPLLVSIGFIAGNMVMVPLAIGILSKIVLMTPAYDYFFTYLSYNDFSFAFISGMVWYGALMSMLELPKFFKTVLKKLKITYASDSVSFKASGVVHYALWAAVLACVSAMLFWFNFGLLFQLYLIVFTALCAYQLMCIGGEFGLAPVARFATFVMMPALLLFDVNNVQLVVISTFVEVCGGVAVDVLFGRKLAQLSELDKKMVRRFQWLGLAVSAVSVGIIFWILITKFGLGSAPLIAQRSQTRALTIQFKNFDFYAIILGALFGTMLKDFKISPIMVLGGILMPLEWATTLIIGGALASLTKKAEEYHLYWSGVFAAASIIMIVKALL